MKSTRVVRLTPSMQVGAGWLEAIGDYESSQRAGGAPKTTLATRRQHLQHMARRIGVEPWEMTGDVLVTWAGEQEWARATRRSRRTTFQSFYGWAKATKRIKKNPSKALPRVKPTPPAPRPCPDDAYLTALVRADETETMWLELGADHGLRRGEIAIVHTTDIEIDLVGYSLLVHGKGAVKRTIPLTESMARKLLDIATERTGYVFPGDDGGHISPRWLGKKVNRLLPDQWTIHSLRHRFANRAMETSGDLFVVQDLLGHASPATTRVYVVVDRSKMRAAVRAAAGVGPVQSRELATAT